MFHQIIIQYKDTNFFGIFLSLGVVVVCVHGLGVLLRINSSLPIQTLKVTNHLHLCFNNELVLST
jgi:hypothetical protein